MTAADHAVRLHYEITGERPLLRVVTRYDQELFVNVRVERREAPLLMDSRR